MIDFEKPFICNKKLLKAAYRNHCGYSFENVGKEFIEILRHAPVQIHIPNTEYEIDNFNSREYTNFLEELFALQEIILWNENEFDAQAFEDYIYPYASIFLLTKEYSDDLLCYLYVVGTKFCNPWCLCTEICDTQKVLDDYYYDRLTRKKVIEIVARFLVLYFMYYDDLPVFNDFLSLEDYETQIAKR